MPTLSPESVEIAARHQVFLERLKTHEANKFNEVLRQIDRTIREKISAVDFQSLTEKQLERLIQRVNESVATLLDGYIAENAKALRETARYEAGFEARAIQQVAQRAGFAAVVPAAAEVYAVLDTRPMSVRDSRAGMTVPQVAKAFKLGQLERLQNRIRLGYFEGLSTQQMLTSIRGLARLNYQDGELAQVAKAASVFARDSFQMASSSGKFAAMSVNNIREYEWVSKLDSRTSSKCRSLDGMQFELGKGPLPPIHPNCLPADCLVSAGCDITGVSKRWFDGELVTIKTASGNVITCTPNHPILTTSGWVAASLINEGSKVISSGGRKRVSGANAKNDDREAAIGDVVESFLATRGVASVPVPVTAPHFHGDGAGSEVAVIGANRVLLGEVYSALGEEFGELNLILGNLPTSRKRSLNKLFIACLSTSDGIMGRLSEVRDLFIRSAGHAGKLLLASVARLKSCLFDNHASSLNGANAPFVDSAQSDTVIEKPDNFFSVDALSGKFRFRFYLDPAAADDAKSGAIADADLARSICDGDSSFSVYADEVISFNRASFSGHVYNLETVDGFYIAGGIVTHNCRSTITPILPDSLKPLTDAATRNAEGGAVDSDATYYSWLKTQPTKFVEEVLGKSRAKLFLNGEISAERFAKLSLDRNFQPLTLDEMRKLEPLAFERAGL